MDDRLELDPEETGPGSDGGGMDTGAVSLDPSRNTRDLVRAVVAALESQRADEVRALVEGLHNADIADLIEQLRPDDRSLIREALGDDFAPEILVELEDEVRDAVLEDFEPEEIANAVSQLDSDDAITLLEDLEEPEQKKVLDAIPADERAPLVESLSYPDDSAGRMMQRELIAVPQFWTLGQVRAYLNSEEDLPHQFYEIFVVDPGHKPVGTMPLSLVLRCSQDSAVEDIMWREQTLIPVDEDQEDVAYRFTQYHLISAAVVDVAGRLVGMITADDIVEVIEEEAEEDILALAGVSEGDINIPVREEAANRFIWLLTNLGTAIMASLVIAMFDQSIEKLVALAILMPIVASMGGNAGTQTMTIAVRALATKELTASNARRIVNKEVLVSLINGVMLSVLMGVLGGIWFGNESLGFVLAAAMVINMVVAGLAGILIPLGLSKVGADPAVASTVFVTTITDVVGFFVFLGLAASFLT